MENRIYFDDAMNLYDKWPSPHLIISDGPYGLGLYKNELRHVHTLAEWYEPHIEAWTRYSNPATTLWLWNTEQGWANIHNMIVKHGWNYQETTVWNKGISHIAGRVNSKTTRKLPVVTEIAVRYTRKPEISFNNKTISLQQWLRNEWLRSGLPLSKANIACGVKNAATRKYLVQDDCWYFPPLSAIYKMAQYCHLHGMPTSKPYFLNDDINSGEWESMADAWNEKKSEHINIQQAVWNHVHGRTNIWDYPSLKGNERIKINGKNLHINQKPIELITRQILHSTHENHIVWEPFGGTGTACISAIRNQRNSYTAEIHNEYFQIIKNRFRSELKNND